MEATPPGALPPIDMAEVFPQLYGAPSLDIAGLPRPTLVRIFASADQWSQSATAGGRESKSKAAVHARGEIRASVTAVKDEVAALNAYPKVCAYKHYDASTRKLEWGVSFLTIIDSSWVYEAPAIPSDIPLILRGVEVGTASNGDLNVTVAWFAAQRFDPGVERRLDEAVNAALVLELQAACGDDRLDGGTTLIVKRSTHEGGDSGNCSVWLRNCDGDVVEFVTPSTLGTHTTLHAVMMRALRNTVRKDLPPPREGMDRDHQGVEFKEIASRFITFYGGVMALVPYLKTAPRMYDCRMDAGRMDANHGVVIKGVAGEQFRRLHQHLAQVVEVDRSDHRRRTHGWSDEEEAIRAGRRGFVAAHGMTMSVGKILLVKTIRAASSRSPRRKPLVVRNSCAAMYAAMPEKYECIAHGEHWTIVNERSSDVSSPRSRKKTTITWHYHDGGTVVFTRDAVSSDASPSDSRGCWARGLSTEECKDLARAMDISEGRWPVKVDLKIVGVGPTRGRKRSRSQHSSEEESGGGSE